jgi:hypothetical protein
MQWLRLTIVTALLALLSGTAFAQTTWEAMQKFGLTGTWSTSCKDAASASNFRMTYYQDASGVVRRTGDRGPSAPSLAVTFDSAKLITSTTLAARVRNDDPNWGTSNGATSDIVMIKENGRMRTLESTTPDGQQIVKDGIIVSSGTPIAWVEKCSN